MEMEILIGFSQKNPIKFGLKPLIVFQSNRWLKPTAMKKDVGTQ